MPLQETKFSGNRVQLRRSSRLQRCNRFSNTADDPIDLEPTKQSEVNNNMKDDQQNSTPTTSEGIRKKRYKHAAKKNKVKPGQKSTPDSDEEAHPKAKRPNFHLPTKKDANEKYEEKLRERHAIDVYGGPFGFGLIMKPLRDLPSSQEQTATENAKGNDKGKDVPNPSLDDWNSHQNDDDLWEEWERAQRQSVQNETNDREDVRDTEQHIQVEQQHDDGQASSEKDFVESIRSMANELIDTKLLFDTELNLALQKYPTNEQLLDIKNIVFNVFHQQGTEKTTNTGPPEQTTKTLSPEQTTNTRPTYSRPSEQCTHSSPLEENTDTEEFQDCYEEEDFQLTIEDVEQLDLLSFVDSAKINAQQTELFETDTVGEIYPSFSLGIDDEEDIPPITPKPALREKFQSTENWSIWKISLH
ncbi:hypothetical protein ACET3Z_017972 [Daucus carota]